MKDHHQILIVGGGTGGLTVAAQLRTHDPTLDVAVLEPSTKHYYQPLWTLVGGGVFPREESMREEADCIPRGVTWIRDAAAAVDPDAKRVDLEGGRAIGYDFLVLAPGIKLEWDLVPGLSDALADPGSGVCSNYGYEHVEKTWRTIRAFRGGTALFTEPKTPVKCGGAPQKIMYLAEETFRKNGVRDDARVAFMNAKASIFSSPYYARTLVDICRERGIDVVYEHDLVSIRPAEKTAVFKNLETGELIDVRYDMMHVTPPMTAPDFIRKSPLADGGGWIDVDRHTLRHVRYPDVFALGDASSLPTSKTGAAIRKQAPVVVENLLAALHAEAGTARYDGYTSCPLVTGYGKLILAEFDYDRKPVESFPFDQNRERYSMWALKAYGLPKLYWHGMLRGRM